MQRVIVIGLLFYLYTASTFADNPLHHNGVSRVYDPYVQALEKEIELRTFFQQDDDPVEDGLLRQSITYGFSLNDRVFTEVYLKGVKLPGQSFEPDAYELETKIQLTEQGEYNADWGLLFEYEREFSESIAEVAAVLLTSRQWGDWVATLNLGLEYEFGSNIDDEIDRFASMQLRYRLQETFEPGVEFYADEFTRGLGPMISGLIRGGNNKKWYWEAGIIAGLNDTTPERTFRFLLEYEF